MLASAPEYSKEAIIVAKVSGLANSPNPFKLAVFGLNVDHGCSMTAAEGVFTGDWEESKTLAQTADRIGLEALISVARWRGFGGTTNFNDISFDTIAWAAALAPITESIQIFSTVHVPTIHPVRMAKAAATIDHVSQGRYGLNIVAGWNPGEIAMFGALQKEHDERYAVAGEWIEAIRRMWTEDTFDFAGKYFTIPAAHSEPKPLQQPAPTVMSAGASIAGSDFAAQHADCQFISLLGVDDLRARTTGLKEYARRNYQRDVKIFTTTYIMCRDTEQEARDYFDHVVHECGDWEGARNMVRGLLPNVENIEDNSAMLEGLIAGYAGHPLIGTPDQVVDGMKALAESGIDGVTLSWVNYAHGLDQLENELLPRMKAVGLRA